MSKIIIANWKMNLSVDKGLDFVRHIKAGKNQAVIAAPYTFLCEIGKLAKKRKLGLAAQDVSPFTEGAHTGEVSAQMLKEIGCRYCLVGHSERRIYNNETNSDINRKITQLLSVKIKPVLCIGEKSDERRRGLTTQVLKRQLTLGLKGVKQPQNILIAYEPVWAISTFQTGKVKKSASLDDISQVHQHIRKLLKNIYSTQAGKIKVLYGGTVKPENSRDILSLKLVDGALVGGASLKYASFNAILLSVA